MWRLSIAMMSFLVLMKRKDRLTSTISHESNRQLNFEDAEVATMYSNQHSDKPLANDDLSHHRVSQEQCSHFLAQTCVFNICLGGASRIREFRSR